MDDRVASAVEALYGLYHKDIVRFFADHLTDRETAWDLCHEVFLRLLLALAGGVELRQPQRWLMRVAKNLLIDTYRQRQAAPVAVPLDQGKGLLAGDAETFWTLLERGDVLQLLTEAFQALPEKLRRLLFWREIEGLSLQEIVLRTGEKEAVISTELWRARGRLQKEYQRRRFKDLLRSDEEIFGQLDALLRFDVTVPPEEQLRGIEKRERDYFERIAPTWDAYVASAYEADLQERLKRLLPWHKEMTVLDAGTGTGYLAGMVAPLVGEVIGVDCSPNMLGRAGEKMAQEGYEHVSLREGMAEELPIANGSVDVAMCHMLLHHVVSPRTVLGELRRIVRPGGYLLIVDAHAHKHHWTPEAFGDLHYGTNLRKLRHHMADWRVKTLQVEEAGVSHSGDFVGRKADFTNFLVLGQVGEERRAGTVEEQGGQRRYWRDG